MPDAAPSLPLPDPVAIPSATLDPVLPAPAPAPAPLSLYAGYPPAPSPSLLTGTRPKRTKKTTEKAVIKAKSSSAKATRGRRGNVKTEGLGEAPTVAVTSEFGDSFDEGDEEMKEANSKKRTAMEAHAPSEVQGLGEYVADKDFHGPDLTKDRDTDDDL